MHERLLQLQPGERVLDIACGNGVFSRKMADLGAEVVACDFSGNLVARAISRSAEYRDRITYRQVDATDENQLLALGIGQFDAALCSMAMMDMPAIEPMMSALNQVLRPGGRFVFSVMHPCFNSMGTRLAMEEEDKDGELVVTRSIKVVSYLSQAASKGLAIVGQPAPQYYFHRPLHVLLGACFQAGFVMDALEEPIEPEVEEGSGPTRPFSWAYFREIPPVLAARMRLIGA